MLPPLFCSSGPLSFDNHTRKRPKDQRQKSGTRSKSLITCRKARPFSSPQNFFNFRETAARKCFWKSWTTRNAYEQNPLEIHFHRVRRGAVNLSYHRNGRPVGCADTAGGTCDVGLREPHRSRTAA